MVPAKLTAAATGPIDGSGSAQRTHLMADSVMSSQSTSAAVATGWTAGLVTLFRLVVVAASGNNMSMHRFMTPNTIREIDRRR